MKMLSSSAQSLLSLIKAPFVHQPNDFVADAAGRIPIFALIEDVAQCRSAETLRGKTVVLAMPGQLQTIAALMHLDGIAGRIVLCPNDVLQAQIEMISRMAGADIVITEWPLPHALDDESPSLAWRGNVSADEIGEPPTEWVLFTSGTTGQPKMVVHTLSSLAGHLTPNAATPSKRVWCSFYDIRRYGGLQILLRMLVGGGSLVLSSQEETIAAFLARAAAENATHFLGTPSHWRLAMMTNAKALIAPSYVRLSGEVADQAILDHLRAAYPTAELVHAFASTEAGLAFEVSDGKAGFPARLIESAGSAELRVKAGTLQVRSARLAAGTLDRDITKLVDEDGFIDTGDVVERIDGRYHFSGRRDGVINIGGQKVHPEEVEAVLNQHPEVQMSLVRARTSSITGALIMAEVVRRSTVHADVQAPTQRAGSLESDIRAFARARLAPHKVPVSVKLVGQLNMTPTGKLVRSGA